MTIFHYVCSQSPIEASALIRDIGQGNPKTGKEAYDRMMQIMRNGTDDEKRILISGLANIHPDRDIFASDEMSVMYEKIVDPMGNASKAEKFGTDTNKLNACGCGGHENSLPATGAETSVSPVYDSSEFAELREFKQKMEQKSLVVDVLWKTGVIVVILGICYTLYVRSRGSSGIETPGL